MDRVYNFSSGPAMLPKEVLERAQDELLNYKGTGMSVMELPVKAPEVEEIMLSCEKNCRELLEIPSNYKVLFLQGGSTSQYAAVPLNLLSERKCADYIITGQRSRNAYLEAKFASKPGVRTAEGGEIFNFYTDPVYTGDNPPKEYPGNTANKGAFAQNFGTHADGEYSSASGWNSTASGGIAHAEGKETKASGYASHTEGSLTKASGAQAHAEGKETEACKKTSWWSA